jgi:hypothetical protein
MSPEPSCVIGLSVFETTLDEFDVALWGFDSVLRLLFEGVKHIHRQFKANRVNGAVGVAVEIFDKFDHTTTDAFQHLGRSGMLSGLGQEQFKAAGFLFGGNSP